MKFTVSSTDLFNQLRPLSGVLPGRGNPLPILDGFLFVLDGNNLSITASDLETTVTSVMEVEGKSNGSAVLSGKLLVKALKLLKGQHLTFSVNKAHVASIKSAEGTYSIPGYTAMEYPKTPVLEKAAKFTVSASILSGAISKTVWACGNDDLRPVMSGILYELSEGQLRLVATDAHRLAIQTYTGVKNKRVAAFIVPKKTNAMLAAFLKTTSGPVAVQYTEAGALFSFGGTQVYCRLIDGKYPNYEFVFPKDTTTTATVNRVSFIGCMSRMRAFSNSITHQAIMNFFGGGMSVKSEDLDTSASASEDFPCEVSGEVLRIGFNTNYLIDILSHMSGKQVVLRMSKPNRAATIEPVEVIDGEATKMLVMPVMIND